ncbi:MAG TPA: hypothetical protein VF954_06405 [Acidimicrobiales bacterium]
MSDDHVPQDGDPVRRAAGRAVDVPDADALEQASPAGEEEEVDTWRITAERSIDVPEADALEQAEEVTDWDERD